MWIMVLLYLLSWNYLKRNGEIDHTTINMAKSAQYEKFYILYKDNQYRYFTFAAINQTVFPVRFVCRLKGGASVWMPGHLTGGRFLMESTEIQVKWRILRYTL